MKRFSKSVIIFVICFLISILALISLPWFIAVLLVALTGYFSYKVVYWYDVYLDSKFSSYVCDTFDDDIAERKRMR